MNQWWNVPLYVDHRAASPPAPMPYGDRTLSIDFDFLDAPRRHRRTATAAPARCRSPPRPVCDFHDALFAELAAIDVHVRHRRPRRRSAR